MMNSFELDPALAGNELGDNTELRASLPVLQGSSALPLEVLLGPSGTTNNRSGSSELSDCDKAGDDEEDDDNDESDDNQESPDEAMDASNDEDDDDDDDEEKDDEPQAGGQSGNESAVSDRMRAGLAGFDDDTDESGGISAAQAEILSQSRPPGLPPLPPRDFNTISKSLPGRSLGVAAGDDRGNAELNRLISAIRDNSGSVAPTTATNKGVLGQEWDRTTQEEQAALDEDDELLGNRRRGGRGRLSLAEMEPSREVKAMLGQANLAYVHGKTDEAVKILTEIIRIEPNTKPAWYTLSSIHQDLGNRDKAIQLRIVVTHLERSNSVQWRELAEQSKEMKLIEQAIYCYGQAIKADKTDRLALFGRALLLRETGKVPQAIKGLNACLKLSPYDPMILRELGPMYWTLQDTGAAINLYLKALEHWMTQVPQPLSPAQVKGFSIEEIAMLADFLRSQKRYREAAKVVVDGQRWLQGRKNEELTWMAFGDDREFDKHRKSRPDWETHAQKWVEELPVNRLDPGLRLRLGICRLYESRPSEAKIHFDIVTEVDVSDKPDFFGEIADAYFDRQMYPEALEMYFDMSENEATNVPAVWIQIARCQRRNGDFKNAIECYQAVIESDPNDLDSKLALAELYERTDERDMALELVTQVLKVSTQPIDTATILNGERIDSMLTRHEKPPSPTMSASSGGAYDNNEGIDESRLSASRQESGTPAADSIRGKKHRKSGVWGRRTTATNNRILDDLRKQEIFNEAMSRMADVEAIIGTIPRPEAWTGQQAIPDNLLSDWLEQASIIIDMYRTTRALFPSDGKSVYTGLVKKYRRKANTEPNLMEQASDMAVRLQATMTNEPEEATQDETDEIVAADSFRGVSFDDWALLGAKFAARLTMAGDRADAEEALKHLLTSSMMRQNPKRAQLLAFGLAICALEQDDFEGASDAIRKVMAAHPRESEPLRILSAICSSGLRALDAIINTRLQKYMLRQVKFIDNIALSGGKALADESDDEPEQNVIKDGDRFVPKKVNPIFLTMYAHIMACGKSYTTAMVYYLRAYEIHPDDPLICLSLALAYAHRAMQRQVDNRHAHLVQALALLDSYRNLRGNEEEVNYNIARIFHQIGILDLATRHYEKVLEIADARIEQGKSRDSWNVTQEAAYNLSIIYFTRGAPDFARAISDKYLSI